MKTIEDQAQAIENWFDEQEKTNEDYSGRPPPWHHGVDHTNHRERVRELLAMDAKPVTMQDYDKFLLKVFGDEEKYDDFLKPIKDSKYQYLVTPEDLIPNEYTFKIARHIQERSLMDIIERTIKHNEYTSYFITDDRTLEFVGFVSYKDDSRSKIVVGIKVFRFDDGDVTKDLLSLINNLVDTHEETHWDAIAKNKATKAYRVYILKKKCEGFVTEVKPYSVPIKNGDGTVTVVKAIHYVVKRKK
jgi:hypothetical protein